MKTMITLLILISAQISKADLKSQLQAALEASQNEKQSSVTQLQVDDQSVKAKWKSNGVATLKDPSLTLVADDSKLSSGVSASKSDEEVVLDGREAEIAREFQESKAVAVEKNHIK